MADDTRIPNLSPPEPLDGTELLVVEQGGVTRRLPTGDLAALYASAEHEDDQANPHGVTAAQAGADPAGAAAGAVADHEAAADPHEQYMRRAEVPYDLLFGLAGQASAGDRDYVVVARDVTLEGSGYAVADPGPAGTEEWLFTIAVNGTAIGYARVSSTPVISLSATDLSAGDIVSVTADADAPGSMADPRIALRAVLR